MKIYALFLMLLFPIFSPAVYAQEIFDITSFASPSGWTKEPSQTGEAIRFSNEDSERSSFAMITVFKAIPAGTNSKANFDLAWEELAKRTLGANSPQMNPVKEQNGWKVQSGLAAFQKDGLSGVALLTTASGDNKMVNILVVTNSDVFQNEIEKFFASVSLRTILSTNTRPKASAGTQSSDFPKEKPELWMNRRNTYFLNDSGDANPKTLTDLYLIYPNGDYFPNVPYEGLVNVSRSYQSESWGKFTRRGNKGRFKNRYDDVAVTIKSATYMEKDGYTFGFHKFLPVDGLRFEGFYTHVSPDWGKDPKLDYLNNSGCQFTIHFKKDGTFDDRGIFSTSINSCISGKGTYSIENFTITFKYNDGRIIHRLFSAPPTRDPTTYNETLYIGNTAYYKKLAR